MSKRSGTRLSLLLTVVVLLLVIWRLASASGEAVSPRPTSLPEPLPTDSLPAPETLPPLQLPAPAGGSAPAAVTGEAAGPLEIHEITLFGGDGVELKNISRETVRLSDYYLSDKYKERLQLQLPDEELEPGALFVAEGLSLSVKGDELWLSDGEGRLLDHALAQGLAPGGSMGRVPGESGWFYFASPSLGEENSGGFRRVSGMPQADLPGGVYDDVESVTVTLSGPGVIHYTTDGRAPSAASAVYSEPLELKRTTILRAVAIEEGALPGPVLTCHFFLNEYHTLPIVSRISASRTVSSGSQSIHSGSISVLFNENAAR